jgi:hypothetical protein
MLRTTDEPPTAGKGEPRMVLREGRERRETPTEDAKESWLLHNDSVPLRRETRMLR